MKDQIHFFMSYRVKATTTGVIFCDNIPTREEAERHILSISGLIALTGIHTDYKVEDFKIEKVKDN